jgi:hypothetical protein
VQYRDTTFRLYAALFNEAHQALTKEAGFGTQTGRAMDWLSRLAAKPSTVKRYRDVADDAAQAVARAEAEAARYRQLANKATSAAPTATKGRNAALGALGVTGAVGIPGAYLMGKEKGQENKTRTRNLAFGAGAASGLAAPHLIRGLSNIAQSAGNTGLFPELQEYSGMGYPQGGF